ncbi:MAG: efflux RND transporter periplasmic adaptor subunit [Planctomycetota bacterium]|jgi:membrane fusion protein (multidrug efflux system)|nr:efflux RND transporter periplasmic adaptor subunit [Planctomycetota bacterium]
MPRLRPQWKKIGETALGLAILLAAGWLYRSATANNAAPPAPRETAAPRVVVATLAPEKFTQTVEALGAASANEATVITAGAQEKVAAVYFTDGESVPAGKLLVELVTEEEVAALRSAEINLAEEARELQRFNRLRAEKTISAKDLEARQSAFARAETLLAIARARLDDRHIRAPFAGELGKRAVSVGDLVSPGTVITTLDDLSAIKVDFNIPEKYLAQLRVGQEFAVTNEAYPDAVFTGKIAMIAPRLHEATHSATARGVVPNGDDGRRLYPGMLLIVKLALGVVEVVTAPEKAVLSVGERQFLFIYDDATGTVARREIKLGARRDGRVAVLSGAVAGEKFVADGVVKLSDGMKVVAEVN